MRVSELIIEVLASRDFGERIDETAAATAPSTAQKRRMGFLRRPPPRRQGQRLEGSGGGMCLSRKWAWVKAIGRVRAVLQWGRDVSIPEIVRAGDVALERCGFNGAGMFLSRKWYPSSFSRRK